MSYPTEPDWRRMPASAVPLNIDGPEFVRLRANDAHRYAEECRDQAERAAKTASGWAKKADKAEAEADRWARAAEAFTEAWPTEETT